MKEYYKATTDEDGNTALSQVPAPCDCSVQAAFPCTECGADATIGMSDLQGPDGQLIGKEERLCMRCTKRRGGFNPFEPNASTQLGAGSD